MPVTPSRHLVLIAHGSRRQASNEEVERFAGQVDAALRGRAAYTAVRCAFLELAEPSIPAALDRAVAEGASEVDLFPYFLAAGRHVAEDIPAIVEDRRAAHPSVTFRVLDHLGAWPALPEFVAGKLQGVAGSDADGAG